MKANRLMRGAVAALLLLQTATPALAAISPAQRPTTRLLTARDLARTIGGLEARLTNVPVTGGALLPLPSGNRVDLEITAHLGDLNFANATVTATGATGSPGVVVALPVTLVSTANVGPSGAHTGTVGYYSVDVGPACAQGSAVVLNIRGTLFGQFTAETSRWVSCS